MCLALWHRSKKAYQILTESGFIQLPSKRLLQYHKAKLKQRPGRNTDVLMWMRNSAKEKKIPPAGYCGYITFDEMSIQDDIQMRKCGDSFELVGVVNLGEVYEDITSMQTGEDRLQVASHLLQFMFTGSTGFRTQFCYYPTIEVDAVTLYHKFWDAVYDLLDYGFTTLLCICDGAQANRTFINLHFKDLDPFQEKYTTTNIYTGEPLIFMVDPPHNFKKLRNNLLKSADNNNSPRCLELDGIKVLWSHLRDAYSYDCMHNPISSFKFLTPEHLDPGSAEKMRNHLADDVLGHKMLLLLENYQTFMSAKGITNPNIEKTMAFIDNTSKLLKTFKTSTPYRSTNDPRFEINKQCLDWFCAWEKQVNSLIHVEAKQRNKKFIAQKTKFDMFSMIIGFESYCKTMFMKYPGCQVIASGTSQDRLENFFGELRSLNGQADNPNMLQIEQSITGILQMQELRSHQGNCRVADQPPKCG